MRKTQYLTTKDLAQRWRVREETLRAWRVRKVGPPWRKIGPLVRYTLRAVEKYEKGAER